MDSIYKQMNEIDDTASLTKTTGVTSSPVRLPKITFYDVGHYNYDGLTDAVPEIEKQVKWVDEDPMKVLWAIESPKQKLKSLFIEHPELIDKVVKKFKLHVKKLLADYTFNKNNAVNKLKGIICEDADRYVSNTDQIKSLGSRELYKVINTALNEYINSSSIDEAYDTLFNVWNYPSRNPITIEKFEYVRPSDIGEPEHSAVVNSSFHTYYYHKVVVDVVGKKVEFIYTFADYYSGGWN